MSYANAKKLRGLPWKVAVDPFEATPREIRNILVMDCNGSTIAIIDNHQAWKHLEADRLAIAEWIVSEANRIAD